MKLSVFKELYKKAFSAAGGQPEKCEGVLWADKLPEITVAEFIERSDTEPAWLLSMLRFNWNDLSEKERITCINVLSKTGSHKSLLNRSLFKQDLTEKELEVLVGHLKARGSFKAVERLKKERARNG
jgi:hypothetical protein